MSLASAPKAKKNTLLITFETRSCTDVRGSSVATKKAAPTRAHILAMVMLAVASDCATPHTPGSSGAVRSFRKSTGLHPLGERGRHSFWRDRCSCRTTSPRPGSTLTQVKLGPCENASLLAVSGSRVLKLRRNRAGLSS